VITIFKTKPTKPTEPTEPKRKVINLNLEPMMILVLKMYTHKTGAFYYMFCEHAVQLGLSVVKLEMANPESRQRLFEHIQTQHAPDKLIVDDDAHIYRTGTKVPIVNRRRPFGFNIDLVLRQTIEESRKDLGTHVSAFYEHCFQLAIPLLHAAIQDPEKSLELNKHLQLDHAPDQSLNSQNSYDLLELKHAQETHVQHYEDIENDWDRLLILRFLGVSPAALMETLRSQEGVSENVMQEIVKKILMKDLGAKFHRMGFGDSEVKPRPRNRTHSRTIRRSSKSI